jgi:hypothetical protein
MNLRVTSIGTFAADIVAADGEADVIAVFERSFYLLCKKGIVAVCLEDLGRGPINILVSARDGGAPWQGLVRDGAKARIEAGRIAVAGGFALDVSGALEWAPPDWAAFERARVDVGLQAVRQHLSPGSPAGLSALVFQPTSAAAKTTTALAARDQIRTLTAALPHALQSQTWSADALRAATLLVGLGPGLTPSGDDLLGGLMLALTARGELALRDALWDQIVDELNDLTVPVSAMHLTAAAHGQGHEAVHALINCMLASDTAILPEHIDTVAAIGATSGLDAIAGLVIGLGA